MKRVLSGIQPSGVLHIGNYFGMMEKMIRYQEESDLFAFIANYHAMTTVQDGELLAHNTLETAAAFLALGLDPDKCTFWVQSDVPEVQELTWILSTRTPMGLLERCHSYKDKVAKGLIPNHGLFAYPVLMTADILLYHSDVVPVGRDQKQHLEVARDIAIKFNNQFGDDTFTVPDAEIDDSLAVIPGTDGQKMSKSYGNTIEIFTTKKKLKKSVMGIVTDAAAVEDPKDPDTSNVFAIYSLFIGSEEREALRERFKAGGMGYGEVKKELLEIIWERFEPNRERFDSLMANPDEIREILAKGAEKARATAQETIDKLRKAVGLLY
ncbi:MAG: tryptophan--tRNA ligase [Deltaproteobacteria bacterium]|nr:MAG: tryptophan--tRNA ligase [Deltaproteobacteria bacterium]